MTDSMESDGLRVRYFDDWKTIRLTCVECEWQGLADPSSVAFNDSELFPESYFRCPSCGQLLLTIEHSATLSEKLAHLDKLSPADRANTLELERQIQEFESLRIKNADELPDLNFAQGPDRLTWDIEISDDDADEMLQQSKWQQQLQNVTPSSSSIALLWMRSARAKLQRDRAAKT